MARTRQFARRRRRNQTQVSKNDRLALFNDSSSPLHDAPEKVKALFVKNQETKDIDIEDFKNLFKEKPTKTNICSHRINQNGDQEQKVFTCYTCCPNDNRTVLFCQKCFIEEQHAGHNYEQQYADDNPCDCGKLGYMGKEASCPQHKSTKIVVEIKEQQKLQFTTFFESLWKIYFYLKNRNHRRCFDRLLEQLSETLQKLVKGSIYYIRMLAQVFLKQIQVGQENTTILNKLFEFQECQRVIEYMVTDMEFRYKFIKALIKYKQQTKSNVYYMETIEEEIISDTELLSKLGQQKIYAQDRTNEYLKYAKQNEAGKKLLSQFIQFSFSTKQSNRDYIEFLVDNFGKNNEFTFEEDVIIFMLAKGFEYLEGKDEPKKQQEEQEEKEEEEEEEEENMDENQEEQEQNQIQEESQENSQSEKEGSNSSDDRNDYLMTKVIKFITEKLVQLIGSNINQTQNYNELFYEKGITRQNINSYLKYAFKNISELLDNENLFLVALMLIYQHENQEEMILKFWDNFYSQKQMIKALDQIYEMITILGKIPLIMGSLGKKQNEQQAQNWFKSYLYENKTIEQRKITDMKEQGLLKFKNAGKIIKQLCSFNEDNRNFEYHSLDSFPNDILKFSQRRYRNQFDTLYGIKIDIHSKLEVKNDLQKKFLNMLFLAHNFFSKFKTKWQRELSKVEKSQYQLQTWKQKRVGYLYVLILLIVDRLCPEKNEEISKELLSIQNDKDYRFKFEFMAKENQISKLLALEKEVEQIQKGCTESFIKKRDEKKKKILAKYKKNNTEVIDNLLTKSKSLHISENQEVCLYCHEKQKQQQPFFYLAYLTKNRTPSSSIYMNQNKVKTLIYTCFHVVHVECFIKIEKDENSEFDCPLCSKRMNCLFPVKIQNLNEECNQIYTNSIISVLVHRYQIYSFGTILNILFCHLVESKGLNSLISPKKYEESKYLRNKVDHYILDLFSELYRESSQKNKSKFEKHVKDLIDKVKQVENQLIKNIQLLLINLFFSKIVLGYSEVDKDLVMEIKTKLDNSQFQIIKDHIESIAQTLIELPEIMDSEKVSLSLNTISLPDRSDMVDGMTDKTECKKCKKIAKNYLCLLCKDIFCNSCRYDDDHSKFHNSNFIMFEIDRRRIYNIIDNSWRSNDIYFNDFKESYDRINEDQRKMNPCELDKEKLQKIFDEFLDI